MPAPFFLMRISKQVSEKQATVTQHGNEVHKALELYVGGKAALPEKYDNYRPVADKLAHTQGTKLLEHKFGLTKLLKPTEFFAKDVWVRGVLDVAIVKPEEVIVLDYKTGKRKIDNDQLKLSAGAALSLLAVCPCTIVPLFPGCLVNCFQGFGELRIAIMKRFLLVVQWIERVPPKRQIQVRFLSGRPH